MESIKIYARCISFDKPVAARLSVEGVVTIEGGAFSLLNPIIESGLLNIRCLVEFLGFKRNSKDGSLVARGGRPDDVVIESFYFGGAPLSKVTPEDFCSLSKEYPSEAVREATCHTLEMADKAIAHLTESRSVITTDLRQVAVAAECVEAAVMKHLYDSMGLQRPSNGLRIVE
jgi:hypothetical protein